MTITFDGVSSPHKAIIMCDGILEQTKWVTFWPCHPSWSWLMGSLDAVMRRTLPLSRWKRHFELIEGILDLKILGDEAQYGFSHDVAYYVQPYLFLTLATNHIFLIHLKRVEYNASLTDRTVRKNMTESTWKLLLKCSFPNYCEVFKGCHLTHCWHSILNKYSEIDVEIFLVLVGLLTDYLPDYWLPFFILRRDFPLKSQTSSLVWGIEKWKWNRDAKKQKSFDLSVHVWALTIIHNVYYT